MGRLIDVDEVKKRLPIMENDWGMVINETLHKELDKVPTVEVISKADMVAILDKIRAEIDKAYCKVTNDYDRGRNYGLYIAIQIIDKYKAESEDKK